MDEAFAQDHALTARHPACPAAQGERCDTLITFVNDRPGDDRRYAIEPRKIEAVLGFTPRRTLATGLRETVRWYLGPAASPPAA